MTLGRSIYYISYFSYLSFAWWLPYLLLLYLSEREVLVLYIHLRIFTYTSNNLIVICSTFQSWRCIVSLIVLRRDTYWVSAVSLTLVRYRSQTFDIRSCSRIQKTPALFSTGGRTSIPSGRLRQSLPFTIVSLDWPSWILLVSVCVRGRSNSRALVVFHIASWLRFRCLHQSSSPWINHQHNTLVVRIDVYHW